MPSPTRPWRLRLSPLARAVGLLICATLLAQGGAQAAETSPRLEALDIVTHGGLQHFKVEIADTPSSREQGLMYRKALAPDRGMLFDFKTPQEVAFWMKNTILPLDMVFIAKDGRIVSIARNAVPFDQTPIPSGGPILGVLEINGGVADKEGLEPGDKVVAALFH